MKKNLIMGVSKGYGWWEIEPFIRSWQKNASDAELVLFVDDTSAWTRKCLSITTTGGGNKNLRLIDIPPQYGERLIIDLRWTLFADFLESHRAEYDQVLLTDVRDVIFQGDLFKLYRQNQQYLGYATEGNVIEKSDFNRNWLTNFLGEAAYQSVKDKMIICCGTTWGTVDEVILFARKMEELLVKSTFWGAEQAAANFIIYNNQLPIKTIIESNVVSGGVLTLAWDNTGTRGDSITNLSQEVPPVVHMYTSHPPLIQFVNRLYRSPQLLPIDGFNDVNSILDFVNAVIYHGGLPLALGLMLQTLERHPEPKDWRYAFNHLQKIVQTTLIITPHIFNAEIVEQSVCCALLRVFSAMPVTPDHLDKMFMFMMSAKQQRHTIYKPFEQFLSTFTWQSVKIFIQNNNLQQAAVFVERLENFDHGIGEEFYITAAELNRKLGRKDKALEYYKRLLDR